MRPFIPDIPGLETINFLTNENILEINNIPQSIAIIGGGYIGMEFAHFFSSLGSKVTIIESQDKILSGLDRFLSTEFYKYISNKTKVYLSTKIERIEKILEGAQLHCSNASGKIIVPAEKILVASGRIPNTDTLSLEKCGILTDKRGYIITDEYLSVRPSEIWALGDCAGTPAFRHIANYQADILIKNILYGKRIKPDYTITPAAVFTFPEIATVGITEQTARQKFKNGHKGYCTAIVNADDDKILGFHIIGPYASILIHEILPIMTAGLTYKYIEKTIHIHPALSELAVRTFTEGREI